MKDFAATSAAYLHGDLPAAEQAAFEAALAADPRLRAEHDHFTAMHKHLTEHFAPARAAGDLESRLVRTFRERHARGATSPGGFASRAVVWLRLPAIYVPAAAAILLGLVETGSLLTGEGLRFAHPSPAASFRGALLDQGVATEASVEGGKSSSPLTARAPARGSTTASSTFFRSNVQPQSSVDGRADVGGFVTPAAPKSAAAFNLKSDQSKLAMDADNEVGDDGSAKSPGGPASPASDTRKLIRNASLDLEVRAFAPAAQAVLDLARQAGGYLESRDSTQLPNGKTTGTLVVKIPPPALDGFVTALRDLGEIRHQSVGTEDVTKAYFDSDARLRNARKMEDRLLELLRTTKGKVTELLAVERELARVRERIEELQGQLKLWDGLVAYATVTIQLAEKDLNQAAKYLLKERATLSLASADVPKTYQQARAEAAKAQAQILESSLTADGQNRATAQLRLLLDPDRADGFIAQAKTFGRVLDFHRESERVARDGREDSADARVERDRVQLTIAIASQDETPAQRTQLVLETNAVDAQARALREFAATQSIEIKDSSFEQLPDGRQRASLRLVLPLSAYPAALARVQETGKTRDLSVQRNDPGQPGAIADRAEISLTLTTPPKLVDADSGLLATLRHTFTQAFGAVMWSLRMMGVAAAFLLPWGLALAAVIATVRFILRRRRDR